MEKPYLINKTLIIIKHQVQSIRHTTPILYLLSFSATREGEEDVDREASEYTNEEYKK